MFGTYFLWHVAMVMGFLRGVSWREVLPNPLPVLNVLGLSCVFPAPVLESTFSIRSLVPFIGKWYRKPRSWHKMCSLLTYWLCTQSCRTLWSHALWPVRLLCPWDFPGKNPGVGCHFPVASSRRSSWLRDQTHVSCGTWIDRTTEPLRKLLNWQGKGIFAW